MSILETRQKVSVIEQISPPHDIYTHLRGVKMQDQSINEERRRDNITALRTVAMRGKLTQYVNSILFSYRGRGIVSVLMILVFASTANATFETVTWRWMSGTTATNQLGVCGAAGAFASGNKPGGRKNPTMTAAYNNNIYLFGGYGYPTTGGAGWLGDLWVYRQTCWSCNGEWAWLGGVSNSVNGQGYYTGSTPRPGGRWIATGWFTPPNKFHVLGGHGKDYTSIDGSLSDLWSFNTDTYAWSWIKGSSARNAVAAFGVKGSFSASNMPGGNKWHITLTSKANGTAIIYGGVGYAATSGSLSDTWKYAQGTNQWAWVSGPGVPEQFSNGGAVGVFSAAYYPGGREMCAVMDTTHRTVSDLVYIYGGSGRTSAQNGELADLWAFNIATSQWAFIAGQYTSVGSSALCSYGTLGVFGSTIGSRTDVYIGYSDPNSDLVMIFGGDGVGSTTSPGRLNDFWAFNTTIRQYAWVAGNNVIDQYGSYASSIWFSSSNKPGGRSGAHMSVNHDLGLMFLFGGIGYAASGSEGHLNDLWATKGPTVAIGTSPTPTWDPAVPTPTASPSPTPTATPTWDPAVPTPTATPTASPTSTPTATPVPHLKPVEWRWMSGSSIVVTNGQCGSAGQYGSNYTPGSRIAVKMIPVAYNNAIYLFGGNGFHTSGGPGALGDVWVYHQSCWSCTGEWAWLGGLSNSLDYQGYYGGPTPYPGGRMNSVVWLMQPNLLYVQGGEGYDGLSNLGLLNDLWSFNTDTFAWSWLKGSFVISEYAVYGVMGTPDPVNVPGGSTNSALLKTVGGSVYVFGGNGFSQDPLLAPTSGFLSDTWKFLNQSNEWVWINGPSAHGVGHLSIGGPSGVFSTSNCPGSRSTPAVMVSHGSNLVYVHGGWGMSSTSAGILADTWAFNIVTSQWAYVTGESADGSGPNRFGYLGTFSASSSPPARCFPTGFSDPNSNLLMVHGGANSHGCYNDFWAFNSSTLEWAWASGDSVPHIGGNVYSDASWFSSANKPGLKCSAAASTNQKFGLMYLFGGEIPLPLNVLWATKGATLTVGPSPSPTATPTPTTSPTASPQTSTPTLSPFASPSSSPTLSPTVSPTTLPTNSPSSSPTMSPTTSSTASAPISPTTSPTVSPTMSPPTASPTMSPTSPTTLPTASAPISPTTSPTVSPTMSPPTASPTASPTTAPSPTTTPSSNQTTSPTTSPTASPQTPTPTPSFIGPTSMPSASPSPSLFPTMSPTASSTTTPSPTNNPSSSPTMSPTTIPTTSPTASTPISPTTSPTVSPTMSPPTASPTASPTTAPSPTTSPNSNQTTSPTTSPTASPQTPTPTPSFIGLTSTPSASPNPSLSPTMSPTASPCSSPTMSQTFNPTTSPSASSTTSPTMSPTTSLLETPTVTPSPSLSPVASPTISSTTSPTAYPTNLPTSTTSGAAGSSAAIGGGFDEMLIYIIICVSGLVGGIAVICFVLLITKRGRAALKSFMHPKKKREERIQMVTISGEPGGNTKSAEAPIIQHVHLQQITQVVINSDTTQNQLQEDGYGICHFPQVSNDASQLNASQGDVCHVESIDESNGWAFCSVIDNSSRQVVASGWYPSAWISPISSDQFCEMLDDEEERIPLCQQLASEN